MFVFKEKKTGYKTSKNIQTHFNVPVFQFCVSDVGTLSTLIAPGATSSAPEPAAATSERTGDTESGPAKKSGIVMVM